MENKHKSKTAKRDRMRRILCLILAIMMVGGTAVTLVYNLLLTRVYAADADDTAVFSASASDTKRVRVGLMYGENVTVGFETDAANGFGIETVDRSVPDLPSREIWEISLTKVAAVVDGNLAKTDMTYRVASGNDTIKIGGYHVGIGSGMTRETCETMLAALDETLASLGYDVFPFYGDSGFSLRSGNFATSADAQAAASKISSVIADLDIYTVFPTKTGVSLVNPYTDEILFEYDASDVTALGLTARPSSDGTKNYLVTPAKKQYDGIFMFRRENIATDPNAGYTDGVSLTNVMELGDYIEGVLPYEISSSWPLESQKAFAIVVRSYTMSSLNRHKAYGFDLCNSTHCQVYQGRARVTDVVEQAVRETSGQVMIYDGKIVQAFYSAVSGGVTVSAKDAWGSEVPYLHAIETPWEIYTNHSYGTWQTEVSPSELADYLRSKGYSISGNVASITIDRLADNSTYIAELTITGTSGGSVTIKRTDSVRSALAKYVKSANFVVGKGKVDADITTFNTESMTSTPVITASGTTSHDNSTGVAVMTASGKASIPDMNSATAVTSNGTKQLGKVTSTTVRQTVYAKNSGNFIFVGKGYGHGVGLSQIGLRDLAKQGVAAKDMLKMYFSGIVIDDLATVIK